MARVKKALPYFIAILIGVLISYFVNFYFHPVEVQGDSMNPTFESGDIVKCDIDFELSEIKRGEVVIFKRGLKPYIKRVIAIPGDTVSVNNGYICINDEICPFFKDRIVEPGILDLSEIILSDNEFFCVGDNVNHSSDSREFGPVNFESIKYIVKKKLF